jgi:hypothetical protein
VLANKDSTPEAENSKMVLFPEFATNKFPRLSNAKPTGLSKPVVYELSLMPYGEIFTTEFPVSSVTYKFPDLSKAKQSGPRAPMVENIPRLDPDDENLEIVPDG